MKFSKFALSIRRIQTLRLIYRFIFILIFIFVLSDFSNRNPKIYTTSSHESRKKYPILLVPGTMSSILEIKLNASIISDECASASEFVIAWASDDEKFMNFCAIKYLTMVYDEKEQMMADQKGVTVRPFRFGKVDGIECIKRPCSTHSKYLHSLINFLIKDENYERNQDLVGAPYDFRRIGDPNYMKTYFEMLKNLIENTVEANGFNPIILISHSMGSPIVSEFLISQPKEWKENYIDSQLSLAGAYGGFPQDLASIIFDVEYPYLPKNLSKESLKKFHQSRVGSYYMLPSVEVFGENYNILILPERNYTLKDMDSILREVGPEYGSHVWKSVKKLPLKGDVDVDFACVVGNGIPVTSSFKVLNRTKIMRKSMSTGDGLLPSQSLNACKYLIEENSKHSIYKVIPNLKHSEILRDYNFFMFISEWINRKRP